MFVRKLIAALLLGIYGIPAAVGPHWHDHDHGAAACVEAPQTSSCCCHHHHDGAAGKASPVIPAGVGACPAEGSAAGPCAICQFYATASWQSAAAPPLADTSSVMLVAPLHQSATLSPIHSWQGRGPPAIL